MDSGLDALMLTLVTRTIVGSLACVAFTTVLHVVFVDAESFIDFGTKSFIVVDPITMLVQKRIQG
jgi:hypothetical protein